jgi:hypothetical protein
MSKKTTPKCLALTLKPANSKRPEEETSRCTRFALENSRFCGNHQNLHELTDQQFEDSTKICRQCRKHKYFSDMDYNVCDDDRESSVEKRERQRMEKVVYTPCVICEFTGGNERQYSNYCNKHSTDGQKADIEQRGMKWCRGINRGCPNPELPSDYPHRKCDVCRQKENMQDKKICQTESIKQDDIAGGSTKKIRISLKPKLQTGPSENLDIEVATMSFVATNRKTVLIDSQKVHITQDGFYTYEGETSEGKHCSGCGHFHEKSEFVGLRGNFVKTCLVHCRSVDRARDRSDRDYSIYEQLPATKERRRLWKEQNPDKCRGYWQSFRQRKRTENPTEYLAHLAENMRKYRANRPEYFRNLNEEHKKDMHRKYYVCKYRAKRDEIPFSLTFDECEKLVRGKCVYCGYEPSDGYLLGIDRLFSEQDYTYDNCVTCCEMCNFLKGELYPIVFLYLCENVLIHLGYLQGTQHTEIMFDENSSSYKQYMNTAAEKELLFDITEKQFGELCMQDCYLCGKKTNKPHHINGIDRCDSQLGYILSNCRPCCTMCNYFKNSYDYENFIDQLKLIHANNQITHEDSVLQERQFEKDLKILPPNKEIVKLTEEEYRTMNFRELSDADLPKYRPPTSLGGPRRKWLSETKRRQQGAV